MRDVRVVGGRRPRWQKQAQQQEQLLVASAAARRAISAPPSNPLASPGDTSISTVKGGPMVNLLEVHKLKSQRSN